MKSRNILLSLLLVNLLSLTTAQAQDSLWTRSYRFVGFNQYDLRTSSINFTTAHQVINDAVRDKLKPKMGEKAGNLTAGLIGFSTTYLTMLWSHEFGHFLRARQVGGEFRIHNFGLPIPYTTMHLPDAINLTDESLSVTAGFEVNYLSVRRIQQDFISQNGAYNEDLALAFANRLMYPLYTSVIIPINPRDTSVWIDTGGDPAFIALNVHMNYAGGRLFMSDNSVNPDLVAQYQQSMLFGAFFNLLDPQFYREVGSTFGKNKIRRPIFLIGDHSNGWTYGTLFSVSPLGYELYLNNYLHINEHQWTIYVKWGNPYKNNGMGARWNNLLDTDKTRISVAVDLWDQDLYGAGLAAEVAINRNLFGRWGTSVNVGYKTEGYMMGRQLDSGFNLGMGIVYYADY